MGKGQERIMVCRDKILFERIPLAGTSVLFVSSLHSYNLSRKFYCFLVYTVVSVCRVLS